MAWWESICRIQRGGSVGSGVFVGEDVVLTAGHVVQPMETLAPAPTEIVVTVPFQSGARASVRRVVIHEGWRDANDLLADMALMRTSRVAGVGLGFQVGFGLDGGSHEVALYGYPVGASQATWQSGFVHIAQDATRPDGLYFESATFDVAPGVSGSPFLTMLPDGNVYVVGIATWDSVDPSQSAFNGLPLLTNTFQRLVDAIG